jgi:hypothetical protein
MESTKGNNPMNQFSNRGLALLPLREPGRDLSTKDKNTWTEDSISS